MPRQSKSKKTPEPADEDVAMMEVTPKSEPTKLSNKKRREPPQNGGSGKLLPLPKKQRKSKKVTSKITITIMNDLGLVHHSSSSNTRDTHHTYECLDEEKSNCLLLIPSKLTDAQVQPIENEEYTVKNYTQNEPNQYLVHKYTIIEHVNTPQKSNPNTESKFTLENLRDILTRRDIHEKHNSLVGREENYSYVGINLTGVIFHISRPEETGWGRPKQLISIGDPSGWLNIVKYYNEQETRQYKQNQGSQWIPDNMVGEVVHFNNVNLGRNAADTTRFKRVVCFTFGTYSTWDIITSDADTELSDWSVLIEPRKQFIDERKIKLND